MSTARCVSRATELLAVVGWLIKCAGFQDAGVAAPEKQTGRFLPRYTRDLPTDGDSLGPRGVLEWDDEDQGEKPDRRNGADIE